MLKKSLVSLLVGISMVGLVGCSQEVKKGFEDGIKQAQEEQIEVDNSIKEEEQLEVDNSIKEYGIDNEPRVMPDQLPYNLVLEEPDSIGNVYGDMTFVNNSNYPITSFEVTVLDNTTNEKHYYSCYETVLPGETSPIFNTFASNDMTTLTIEYSIYDKETMLTCYYEYDLKLENLSWGAWIKF